MNMNGGEFVLTIVYPGMFSERPRLIKGSVSLRKAQHSHNINGANKVKKTDGGKRGKEEKRGSLPPAVGKKKGKGIALAGAGADYWMDVSVGKRWKVRYRNLMATVHSNTHSEREKG